MNPTMRVLLLSAKRHTTISSKKPLRVSGVKSSSRAWYRLNIRKRNAKSVLLQNKLVVRGSVFVTSKSPITVGRYRFKGKIEIKPHAGGFYLINHLPLEAYVEGVIGAEIDTGWHPEALKAQAVIARTFAMYRRNANRSKSWHLTARTMDQVYKGVSVTDKASKDSARRTRGLVVMKNNQVVPTYYHANAGGTTEDAGNVWNTSLNHIRPLRVPFGQSDPDYTWQLRYSGARLARLLRSWGYKVRRIDSIFVSKRTISGRVNTLTVRAPQTLKIKATVLRQILGENHLKSLKFDLQKQNATFIFSGIGFGHGVGLCQWCAKEMAEMGQSYKDILSQFYHQVDIGLLKGSSARR